ncbi:MAG TPA: cellulase family glycosylhydrolase [Anaerolineaceae bacterium]|nr:cellulase family glycosylhydrolase [Anaerolineaceae bacterium]HPN52832.1 cellulase family glycosylhydrolase [Anaerolineaceae bacterium]
MKIDGPWFKDESGRTLVLRGINLGGSTKVPFTPDGATWRREGFFNHREVSFVGRPFPLEEADEHFRRLKAWGYTFLRFLVTWEAIEHAGPGIYDEAYLDYLTAVVKKAGEHGLTLFIDPHQDVWSRFSGGDGAPGWTLEAAGMDMTHFHETGAAIVHATTGDPFPRMVWPTNFGKLACATLFTLFFAGSTFAPRLKVDGVPIQDYLQDHYINAIRQIALRLKDFPHVIGYDTLNEPSSGWIGVKNLTYPAGELKMGDAPSPLQAMALGIGIPQLLTQWDISLSGNNPVGARWVNLSKTSAWLPGKDCIWREHGVWDIDSYGQPELLKPDYFWKVDGKPVSFVPDFLVPFFKRFAASIREVDPKAILFLETVPNTEPPAVDPQELPACVNAHHWYDDMTLVMKSFSSFINADTSTGKILLGPAAVHRNFAARLRAIKQTGIEKMGNIPTLIGEFGIPFDLEHKRAYRTGNFSQQEHALDTTYRALEANLLSGTLWNYTADNTNERGDKWNDEDLSLFSRDQQKNPADINSGGRALAAAVRPYPRATAGEPLRMAFYMASGLFEFEFRHDPAISAPTELFLPKLQYPRGVKVEISDGSASYDPETQLLTYQHTSERPTHRIRVRRA